MQFAESELECDPGMVPGGDIEVAIRLCRDCAGKAGANVGEFPHLPLYEQPDELRGLEN